MPDATPGFSDAPPHSASTPEDHFSHLYKMSTTAGLGSGDYVAINGASIASILLGVASALVLFGTPLLLLLPLAGVICGVLALTQISTSNGTQAGRALAVLGLLFSLGFGGYQGGTNLLDSVHNRHERTEILGLIDQFSELIKSSKYDQAYQLCDDHVKNHVPLAVFTNAWRIYNSQRLFGKITAMTWNEVLTFETDAVTSELQAGTMMLVRFEKTEVPSREQVVFRKVNGIWQFDGFPGLFPPESTPPPNNGARSPATAPADVPFGTAGPALPAK